MGEKQREREGGGYKNENLNDHMTRWKKKMKGGKMTKYKDFIAQIFFWREWTEVDGN